MKFLTGFCALVITQKNKRKTNLQNLKGDSMKSFIIAATMILSASAMAASKTYIHGYSDVLGAIALDNACVTDTEVRSINPVKVCTKLVEVPGQLEEGGVRYSNWECASYETKDLAFSRSYEKNVCLKYEPTTEGSTGGCAVLGKKAAFLPSTINVSIVTGLYDEASTERFSTFTFPACN